MAFLGLVTTMIAPGIGDTLCFVGTYLWIRCQTGSGYPRRHGGDTGVTRWSPKKCTAKGNIASLKGTPPTRRRHGATRLSRPRAGRKPLFFSDHCRSGARHYQGTPGDTGVARSPRSKYYPFRVPSTPVTQGATPLQTQCFCLDRVEFHCH